MCGRYGLILRGQDIENEFDVLVEPSSVFPRYNIAPTQDVLTIVLQESQRQGRMMRWGLIPHWAKDAKIGYTMINARAETVVEKPSYKSAFKKRRCLIPATCFYEWKKAGKERTPYRIGLKDWKPFTFPGLWETWHPKEGEPVVSCTIITTVPNEFMSRVHDRMPVILSKDAEKVWLDPDSGEGDLRELLVPPDSSAMYAERISPLINNARNEGPEVIAPVADQDALF